jgi:hypothetical protein
MSNYVKLMQLRKIALLRGDESTAAELMKAAEGLVEAREVTQKELLAAAYL